jgi:hypothetical protein
MTAMRRGNPDVRAGISCPRPSAGGLRDVGTAVARSPKKHLMDGAARRISAQPALSRPDEHEDAKRRDVIMVLKLRLWLLRKRAAESEARNLAH